MIGVIADSEDHAVVREFFELFKTPWEFYRPERRYEALLCAGDGECDTRAKIILRYAGRRLQCDGEQKTRIGGERQPSRVLSYRGDRIPIYGEIVTFSETRSDLLIEEGSQESAAYVEKSGETLVVRIGYDLFGEIRHLLTVGQPSCNANMPAVDLHIALLRDLITGYGVSLVEIPPVPDGYSFIACLTHDVDHPSLRRHKWDHTMFGFLYRAVFGSVWNLIRGRISAGDLFKNWLAALKLPFVYLGVARDPWRQFDDRYLELENGICSTFFVIPFKNYPGQRSNGSAPKYRASRYEAKDIANTIHKLIAAGCEVGLHGIDLWLDSSRGREELAEIRRLTGVPEIGVRMHWLYYDDQSPAVLERAGAAYDATMGYNETVGYRAGTMQAYKPFRAARLLELPLHVMDTALFYPSYLGLSTRQATGLLERMVGEVVRFGGCFTLNWHDRSIAPERLWDTCYRDAVHNLKQRGAWFSTAGQAVSWFEKRRSATFVVDQNGKSTAALNVAAHDHLPGLRFRVHRARVPEQFVGRCSADYVDVAVVEEPISGNPTELAFLSGN